MPSLVQKIVNFAKKPRLAYEPLIDIRIFKNNILHNLSAYRTRYPTLGFAPVLKSNGYGHGLTEMGKILDDSHCPFLVVDSFFEALKLRQEFVKTPILILGYTTLQQISQRVVNNCSIVITSVTQLKMIAKNLHHPQPFHLKLDTGMYRQGILPAEAPEAMRLIRQNPRILLEGICSHLPDAENTDTDFTKRQINTWNELSATFRKEFPTIKYWHLTATAGVDLTKTIDTNICRLGMGLYGINLSPRERLDLKPALRMGTKVSGVKRAPKGAEVGYDRTHTLVRDTILATIPVGYYEGVDRRLSNKGVIAIHGIFCPIIGRVSMNITTVDAGAVPGIGLEDEAVIMSERPEDPNSVEHIAAACHTRAHEILIHIPWYLRRTVT